MVKAQKVFALINILGIGLFFLDRWLKTMALRYLVEGFLFYPDVLGGVGLKLATNQNIAFSVPASGKLLPWFIFILIIVLLFVLIKEYQKIIPNFYLIFALTLIIAGGLSNLLDRLFLGAVVDYVVIFRWPVFNLSDVMITIGTFWWMYLSYWPNKKFG